MNSTVVRLPSSRVLQLKTLATIKASGSDDDIDVTISSLLEKMISREWRHQMGSQPPPDWVIEATRDDSAVPCVEIEHARAGGILLTVGQAKQFAGAIARVIKGESYSAIMADDDGIDEDIISIRGRGPGFVVNIACGLNLGLSKTLLADLGQLVRKAAEAADRMASKGRAAS